jgi:hypothetical protein
MTGHQGEKLEPPKTKINEDISLKELGARIQKTPHGWFIASGAPLGALMTKSSGPLLYIFLGLLLAAAVVIGVSVIKKRKKMKRAQLASITSENT